MTVCTKLLAALVLCVATTAHAEDHPDSLKEQIVRYELTVNPVMNDEVALGLADAVIQEKKRTRISISLLLAIATIESKFNQYALGPDGELGFFQVLTKKHAKKILRMYNKGQIKSMDLYDPYTNARLGAMILQTCLRKYNGSKLHAVACYNGSYPTDKYTKMVISREKKIRKILK